MWTTTDVESRELDHRAADGLDVTLLWYPESNRVSVAVVDVRSGAAFELTVPGADALEAFKHPYAYAIRGPHGGFAEPSGATLGSSSGSS
jgi:hypothetical protein